MGKCLFELNDICDKINETNFNNQIFKRYDQFDNLLTILNKYCELSAQIGYNDYTTNTTNTTNITNSVVDHYLYEELTETSELTNLTNLMDMENNIANDNDTSYISYMSYISDESDESVTSNITCPKQVSFKISENYIKKNNKSHFTIPITIMSIPLIFFAYLIYKKYN